VSWAVDIYPQLLPTGHWQCTGGTCHASGSNGSTQPFIDGSSATAAYTTCVSSRVISPGDTKPFDTELYSLLSSKAMPLTATGAQDATQAELDSLASWIACGSPDN
jgi:hypothetical protein